MMYVYWMVKVYSMCDKNIVGSSLPFSCWLLCMLCFYPCDDHQIIDGSRCEG